MLTHHLTKSVSIIEVFYGAQKRWPLKVSSIVYFPCYCTSNDIYRLYIKQPRYGRSTFDVAISAKLGLIGKFWSLQRMGGP